MNNMISTHTKIFLCEKNGPNLPDFREFTLSPYFYNRFQQIAKYETDS
jgi:hypothetical protein